MTSIDRDPNQDQTPAAEPAASPWLPPAPGQVAHTGKLPGSLNEQPVEEGVGPLREGIYETPVNAEAIAPATPAAVAPEKTTPPTAPAASPEAPRRGRRAGRVVAAVAAVTGIATAALVIGSRSGSETETEATPAAAGDPSPEATTAEPEDPVVVPPTESPTETAPAAPAPTVAPRPTTTDAPRTTTTTPETTLTPEAPLNGSVELVGLQGLQPGANPVEFTRPSGQTEAVPSLDGSSPEMLVKTALNLVAAHATGGNESTADAFTLNPDVRVGFLNDLRQQILDFRGDDSGDWQATIFGHPYDPAQFDVHEENGQITIELVGGTLFLERLSDSFGNNEWQGDWILQGINEDFMGRGARFDSLSMVIGPRDGQLSVNSINFNYVPTHS